MPPAMDALRPAGVLLADELLVTALTLAPVVSEKEFPGQGRIFVIRSASIERLRALFEKLEAHGGCDELHILSHARDESTIRAMAPARDLFFYPYPRVEPYREQDIRPFYEPLKDCDALVFLDAGTLGDGLEVVQRCLAAIKESRVYCFAGDGKMRRIVDVERRILAVETLISLSRWYGATSPASSPAPEQRSEGAMRRAAGLAEYAILTRDLGADPRTTDVDVRNIFSGEVLTAASRRFRTARPFFRNAASRIWFLILCEGRSGGRWLASSLHLHPEIVCSTGVDNPCESLRFYHNPAEQTAMLRFCAERGPMPIVSDVVARSLRERLDREGLTATFCSRDRFKNSFVVLDELDTLVSAKLLGSPKAIGNQHAIQSHELASCLDSFGDPFKGRQPVIAQLIRHPVSRFESRLTAHMRFLDVGWLSDAEIKRISDFCDDHLPELRAIERSFHIDFSDARYRLVFYLIRCCEYQRFWATEAVAYDVEYILFERMKSDPDYFAWVVSYLTNNSVKADNAYLASVFSPTNLTRNRGDGIKDAAPLPANPREQFELWSAWEQHLFRGEVRKYDLQNVYSKLGYDLSFAV